MQTDPLNLPHRSVVEVFSEPTPELLEGHVPALAALLRMALLGGIELTLPTALHLIVDLAGQVVSSDRQLGILGGVHDAPIELQVGRHTDSLALPDVADNCVNQAVVRWCKPLLLEHGIEPHLDSYLDRLQGQTALAVPLFIDHECAGSIQLFRTRPASFTPAEGQLLWLMSLLAENQMARIRTITHLTRVAFTDFLTGLRTRGYFEQALEQEVRRALRRSSSCALLLIDVDDFKSVNDAYGHVAGDEVLRQVARVLTRDMRDIDTVARYGGDEFSIILPDADQEGTRFVATRLRDAIAHTDYRVSEASTSLNLRASIGVALCPGDETQAPSLLRAADAALRQAKYQGKDRPVFSREYRKTGG